MLQLLGTIKDVSACLEREQPVQLVGSNLVTNQLLTLGLFQKFSQSKQTRNFVIVLPSAKHFGQWTEIAELALSKQGLTSILPYYSVWGRDRYVNQNAVKQQRLFSLSRLADATMSGIVVTTLPGLMQKALAKSHLNECSLMIEANAELDLGRFCEQLTNLGYQKVTTVLEEGQFAVRGGIVDVYAPNLIEPIRIEMFADQVDSIRFFSLEHQRSTKSTMQIRLGPANEMVIPNKQRQQFGQRLFNRLIEMDIDAHDRDGMMASFLEGYHFSGMEMFYPILREQSQSALEYLSQSDILFFPHSIDSCLEHAEEFLSSCKQAYCADLKGRKVDVSPDEHFLSLEQTRRFIDHHLTKVDAGNPFHDSRAQKFIINPERLSVAVATESSQSVRFDGWLKVFEQQLEHDGCVVLTFRNEDQLERAKNLLEHRRVQTKPLSYLFEAFDDRVLAKPSRQVFLVLGELDSYWKDHQLLIVPEHELFGHKKRRVKSASQKLQNYLSSFKELKVGGLVVHVEHGIGRYQGMASLQVAGATTDFLIIEYAGGDRVYLPVDRLNLLQRYNSGTDQKQTASLDKLKGLGWQKRKSRVKKSVKDMADQLLKLQARRQVAKGHVFTSPNDEYYKFEAEFPYTETDDQQRAIHDINHDMSQLRPMDRLICGDVGFGKTEVAMRAAFRAVQDGYQVLVLVPTTVLSYQHYRNFKERFEPHQITVAQVNRFVKGLDLESAVGGLERGSVDILIGTHRLLSKDIKPKRLGLLVIDEEQRFGVGHKEKLKELKAGCDVITMTATPIPRTLHMSMLGLRDISVIATPPSDRMAVKTYVARFEEALVKEAIELEVTRGGQVFFVHNRVEDIVEMRNFLKSLLPQVDIRIAHGQMGEQKLENVIVDFIEQKFSVLVCTTIIESGIDMPNVNTLIVNRADRFGLAQLYQIRGRVGRSSRQAYAYFLTPANEPLSDEAKRRLDVLSSHQELGSGFQIASHDLEIRGAGNLLGAEQSGQVAEVGLEMYTDMLEQAIHELRGTPVSEKVDPEIKVSVGALIPKDYISDDGQRLHLYKRLFSADASEELQLLRQEVTDRFGKPEKSVELLFKVAELKRLLRDCRIEVLAHTSRGQFEMKFASLNNQQIDKLLKIAAEQPSRYQLAPDNRMILGYFCDPSQADLEKQAMMLDELKAFLDPLATAFEEG